MSCFNIGKSWLSVFVQVNWKELYLRKRRRKTPAVRETDPVQTRQPVRFFVLFFYIWTNQTDGPRRPSRTTRTCQDIYQQRVRHISVKQAKKRWATTSGWAVAQKPPKRAHVNGSEFPRLFIWRPIRGLNTFGLKFQLWTSF